MYASCMRAGTMQRSIQPCILQGAQQPQSRSALVSQRFAGSQALLLALFLKFPSHYLRSGFVLFSVMSLHPGVRLVRDAQMMICNENRQHLVMKLTLMSADSRVGRAKAPQGRLRNSSSSNACSLCCPIPSCRQQRGAAHTRGALANGYPALALEDSWRSEFQQQCSTAHPGAWPHPRYIRRYCSKAVRCARICCVTC